MKVPALESHRKEAKQRYNEALKNYVTQYFGRPLEKLNVSIELTETVKSIKTLVANLPKFRFRIVWDTLETPPELSTNETVYTLDINGR